MHIMPDRIHTIIESHGQRGHYVQAEGDLNSNRGVDSYIRVKPPADSAGDQWRVNFMAGGRVILSRGTVNAQGAPCNNIFVLDPTQGPVYPDVNVLLPVVTSVPQ